MEGPSPLHSALMALVVAIVTYHAAQRLTDGGSCYRLLTTGSFVTNDTWQPYGCLMHNYTLSETKQCLACRTLVSNTTTRIVLIGDSRVRTIYEGLLRLMMYNRQLPAVNQRLKHVDRHYSNKEAKFDVFFYWRAFMDDAVEELLEKLKKEAEPSIIVMGSALHYIKSNKGVGGGYQAGLLNFSEDLSRLTEWVSALPSRVPVLWMLQEPINYGRLMSTKQNRARKLLKENKSLEKNVSTYRTTAGKATYLMSEIPSHNDFKLPKKTPADSLNGQKKKDPGIMETNSIKTFFEEANEYEELKAYKAEIANVINQKTNQHKKRVWDNSSQLGEDWIMEILETEIEKLERLQPVDRELIKSEGQRINILNGNISEVPTAERLSGLIDDQTAAHWNGSLRNKTTKVDLLIHYNMVADKALSRSRLILWRNIRTIGEIRNWDFPDGIHPGHNTSNHYIQMLLNLLCNSYSPHSDATCCVVHRIPLLDVGLLALCFIACCFLGMALSLKMAAHFRKSTRAQKIQQRWVAVMTQWCYILRRLSGINRGQDVECKAAGEVEDTCFDDKQNKTADLMLEHDKKGVHKFKPAYSSINSIRGTKQMVITIHETKMEESIFSLIHQGNCDLSSLLQNIKTEGRSKATASDFLDCQKSSLQTQKLNRRQQLSVWEMASELLKLIIILAYFLLCDKLDVFMTGQKTFSVYHFWAGLILALTTVGLWSIYRIAREESMEIKVNQPTNAGQVEGNTNARTVNDGHGGGLLSREMTLEWRGWMQVVILVYHVTGASQSLPIYMHVRVLVSAYLFLSGYGHFTRAWTSCRTEGVRRYTQVMFRLNFWTALLCLFMQHPYQFYYFVPLVSFWYSVLYLLLILPPRFSVLEEKGSQRPAGDYGRAALKLMILAGLVAVLENHEDIFTAVFNLPIWRWMFNIGEDDLREWRYRWMLDRFSMLYGTIFVLVYHAWLKLCPDWTRCCFSRTPRILLFVASLIGLCSYGFLLQRCESKEECNNFHPYLAWIPITAYIIIRNQLSSMGLRPSAVLQWLGRISLELFVCQYHILLAAGSRALLVLIPTSPAANILVTVFVFLCVSHQVHLSTETLLRSMILKGWGVKAFVILVLLGAICYASAITSK